MSADTRQGAFENWLDKQFDIMDRLVRPSAQREPVVMSALHSCIGLVNANKTIGELIQQGYTTLRIASIRQCWHLDGTPDFEVVISAEREVTHE